MPRPESPVPTMAKTVSHERRAPDSSFERTGGEREIAPTIDLAAGHPSERSASSRDRWSKRPKPGAPSVWPGLAGQTPQ